MRAIRVRWSDSSKREIAYQAVAQEKAQLEAKLAQLQGGGGGAGAGGAGAGGAVKS